MSESRTVLPAPKLLNLTSVRAEAKKVSAIAPYEDYILKRWKEGCHNATQIHREISEQGYPGAYQNVGYGSPAISRSKKFWESPCRTLRRVSRPPMPRVSS